MNRKLAIGLSVGLLVFALAAWAAGVAMAQTQIGGPMHGQGNGQMRMHAEMMTAFAEVLDLDLATLNARLAAGETMRQIALAEGLTPNEFFAVMQTVRAQALAQAVENGILTQEQANWMLSHTPGSMMGGRGMGSDGMRPGVRMTQCPFSTDQP